MPARILLVDDDCSLLRALRRTLYEQFEVCTASSGFEALERFTSEGPFDCLVTDLKMPLMDGAELVRQVCLQNKQIPCIILSGNQDEESLERAKQSAGTVQLLGKPITKQELIAAIHRAISPMTEVT